jgi:hypothetical protein
LKHHIPLRTDRWDVTEPGWSEIDLVSHSGDRAEGDFACALDLTDIDSAWVERQAILGKSEVRVRAALAAMQGDLPFRHRFRQRPGIHQCPSGPVLPARPDSIHPRAFL